MAVEFCLLVCVKSTLNLTRITDRGEDKNNFCFVSFKPWEEHRLLDKVTTALFWLLAVSLTICMILTDVLNLCD